MIYKIEYVDVMCGEYGMTAVEAPTQKEAEEKFEATFDGCAIVYIKEQKWSVFGYLGIHIVIGQKWLNPMELQNNNGESAVNVIGFSIEI